jgi:hypothetical protein
LTPWESWRSITGTIGPFVLADGVIRCGLGVAERLTATFKSSKGTPVVSLSSANVVVLIPNRSKADASR